jgi:hypothetical protein
MQRAIFASKVQNELPRCTNCRPQRQLLDAPIRARVLALFAERQTLQCNSVLRPASMHAARDFRALHVVVAAAALRGRRRRIEVESTEVELTEVAEPA